MVLLRRDVGYRLLNPVALTVVNGVLLLIGLNGQNAEGLVLFALLSFVTGMGQRKRRWIEFSQNGVLQHSYYIGTSVFDFKWLPKSWTRDRKIARFVDPIFCVLIGLTLVPYEHILALWLIYSGVCLRNFEYVIFCRERDRKLDLIDSLIVSDNQVQSLAQFDAGFNPGQQPPATGIPTGLAPDIQQHIKRRKAK